MNRATVVKLALGLAVIIVLVIGWRMLKGAPVVANAPAAV